MANGGNLSDVFGANASGGITNAQTAYNAISTEWTDTGASNSFGGNTYHQFRNSSVWRTGCNLYHDPQTEEKLI
mgnify:FL=1